VKSLVRIVTLAVIATFAVASFARANVQQTAYAPRARATLHDGAHGYTTLSLPHRARRLHSIRHRHRRWRHRVHATPWAARLSTLRRPEGAPARREPDAPPRGDHLALVSHGTSGGRSAPTPKSGSRDVATNAAGPEAFSEDAIRLNPCDGFRSLTGAGVVHSSRGPPYEFVCETPSRCVKELRLSPARFSLDANVLSRSYFPVFRTDFHARTGTDLPGRVMAEPRSCSRARCQEGMATCLTRPHLEEIDI
jgi:hypothetical protein